eukprot:1137487-Pelagomonas_calceolata.AAC.1
MMDGATEVQIGYKFLIGRSADCTEECTLSRGERCTEVLAEQKCTLSRSVHCTEVHTLSKGAHRA